MKIFILTPYFQICSEWSRGVNFKWLTLNSSDWMSPQILQCLVPVYLKTSWVPCFSFIAFVTERRGSKHFLTVSNGCWFLKTVAISDLTAEGQALQNEKPTFKKLLYRLGTEFFHIWPWARWIFDFNIDGKLKGTGLLW